MCHIASSEFWKAISKLREATSKLQTVTSERQPMTSERWAANINQPWERSALWNNESEEQDAIIFNTMILYFPAFNCLATTSCTHYLLGLCEVICTSWQPMVPYWGLWNNVTYMVAGECHSSLVAAHWSLYGRLLLIGHRLLVTSPCCLSLVTSYSSLVTFHRSLVTSNSLLVTYQRSLITISHVITRIP